MYQRCRSPVVQTRGAKCSERCSEAQSLSAPLQRLAASQYLLSHYGPVLTRRLMYVSAVTSRIVVKSIRSISTTQTFQSLETKSQGLSCGTSIARGSKISVRANCVHVSVSNEKGEIQTACTRRTSILALTTCFVSQVHVPAALSVMVSLCTPVAHQLTRFSGDDCRPNPWVLQVR